MMLYIFSRLVIFAVLLLMYWRTNAGRIKGVLLGTFFVLVFGARFFIEFIKEMEMIRMSDK